MREPTELEREKWSKIKSDFEAKPTKILVIVNYTVLERVLVDGGCLCYCYGGLSYRLRQSQDKGPGT